MNDVIKTILNHRSIRRYKSDPIPDEILDTMIQCAQMAPSSINGQQVSIVIVKDQMRKEQLMRLSSNQAFIAEAPVFLIFCADFYRAHLACKKYGKTLLATDSLDSTLVGAIDVGLAMQNAITAAESLGLGTCPIGGVRRNPSEISRLLNLPDYVFPLCGLVVGYPNEDPEIKPRLPKDAVAFEETYNPDIAPLIDRYDETMKNYMLRRTGGQNASGWSSKIAARYSQPTDRHIRVKMAKKGFKND